MNALKYLRNSKNFKEYTIKLITIETTCDIGIVQFLPFSYNPQINFLITVFQLLVLKIF